MHGLQGAQQLTGFWLLLPHQGLTNAVELLAHLSGDGQARGHVDAALGHLAQVGALAAELQAKKHGQAWVT
jgi:hypothetical protein